MTPSQAAELREKWKQNVVPQSCPHARVELESSDNGYLTGNHHCTVCGESTVPK